MLRVATVSKSSLTLYSHETSCRSHWNELLPKVSDTKLPLHPGVIYFLAGRIWIYLGSSRHVEVHVVDQCKCLISAKQKVYMANAWKRRSECQKPILLASSRLIPPYTSLADHSTIQSQAHWFVAQVLLAQKV